MLASTVAPMSQPPLLSVMRDRTTDSPFPEHNPQLQVSTAGDNHFWTNEDVKVENDPALMSELGLGLGGAADAEEAAPAMRDKMIKVADPFTKGSEIDTLSLEEVNQLFAYNLLMMCLVYFEMLEIPFRMAFTPIYPFEFLIVAAVIDLIFIADLCLRFFLPYLHQDGHYVRGPESKIRWHYMKTWFTPHLIAAIPWDLVWLCVYMANPIMGVEINYFRFIRLMRFARLPEVFIRLGEWEVSLTWYNNPIWFRAARIVSGLLLWVTTNSCIFWLIAVSENLSWGWIATEEARNVNVLESTVWIQYLTSIYWGLTTFSTVGYGDIFGSTVGERAYIIFFALLSIAVTAYATGNVVTWLQSAEAKRTVLADKLDEVKSYIKYRRLPPDLGNKLLRFHRFRGLNSLFSREDSYMLSQLPPALQFKICRVYRDTLFTNWRLAQIVDTLFLTSLVMRMRRETRYPGEYIAIQGTPANRFYILTSGHAVVIRNGVEVMDVVSHTGAHPGVCFGEMVLFSSDTKRSSTLRAVDSCELLYLKGKDMRQLLTKFPDHAPRLEEYAASLQGLRKESLQVRVNAGLIAENKRGRRRMRSASVDLRGLMRENSVKAEQLAVEEEQDDKALDVVPDVEACEERKKKEEKKPAPEKKLMEPIPLLESIDKDKSEASGSSTWHQRRTGMAPIPEMSRSMSEVREAAQQSAPGSRSPRGRKGGKRAMRATRKQMDTPQPTAEELLERVRELPRMPGKMFQKDILNDPMAVGAILIGEQGGIGKRLFAGKEIVDWLQTRYELSREDALYLAQRILRTKSIFYSLGGNVDVEDDWMTHFRVVVNNMSESSVLNLLDVDIVGGTVTKNMQRIIALSVVPRSPAGASVSSSILDRKRVSLDEGLRNRGGTFHPGVFTAEESSLTLPDRPTKPTNNRAEYDDDVDAAVMDSHDDQ